MRRKTELESGYVNMTNKGSERGGEKEKAKESQKEVGRGRRRRTHSCRGCPSSGSILLWSVSLIRGVNRSSLSSFIHQLPIMEML